jgi:hypothetical protein
MLTKKADANVKARKPIVPAGGTSHARLKARSSDDDEEDAAESARRVRHQRGALTLGL